MFGKTELQKVLGNWIKNGGDLYDALRDLSEKMRVTFYRAVAQIEFYLLTPAHLVRLISGFFSSRFLQTHK